MATGKDIFDIALTKKGQKYIEGTLVPKDNPNWPGPWDCAELTSWAVYQVMSVLYGCTNDNALPAHADAYTGAWKEDAQKKGIIIPFQQAAGIVGAMVLRAPAKTEDGRNIGGHIVISDGKGGTIEAKGKAWGVVQDTLNKRRWDYGILVPGIIYNDAHIVKVKLPESIVYRYADPMMVSIKVGEIQKALTNAGFSTKGIDNIYGEKTRDAVIDFQKANDLLVDGEVGESTATALAITL